MKINHISNILSLLCLVLLIAFMTSCEDEGENANGQVELLSFGPSGVHHGDEIVFIGRNLDKVSAIVFHPSVEVSSSAFTSVASDRIKLNVPQSAETGRVILKTPDGDIESKSIFSLEVPVVIATVTEEAKPGTNITITGEFVNWIDSITFANNVTVHKADFVSQSQTEAVITVPFAAQSGFIVFHTGGTEPLSIESEEPISIIVPVITDVAPLSLKHADEVTITGTDLDLITSITFSGDKSTSEFVSQSETEIVVAVPVGTVNGVITLHQASPVDIVSDDALTIILPKATNLTPKPAIPGTDNITITGTNLDLVSELQLVGVDNPILATEFVSQSETQIVLALPAEAINGPVTYTTALGYSNNLGVSVLIPGEGPIPLDYYIYDDGLMNGWSKWDGWNTDEQDFASTEEVFDGTTAIKVTYNGEYGAIQIGAPSAGVFSGYTTFTFRIFAPAPQNFIIQLNNAADSSFPIPAGWSEVNIPIADMDGNGSITELRFKNNNPNLPVTLYFDYIGLKL